MPTQAHENAHSTPYWWCRDNDHPYKGPIRHLKPYLEKVEKERNDDQAKTFDNINKWVNNQPYFFGFCKKATVAAI
jgi:hypothetical protein